MYLRVALIIPLTFCLQTENVKVKRHRYRKILLVVDLLVYAFLCFTFIFQLVRDDEHWCVPAIWSVLSVTVTTSLCFSMLQIRKYTRSLAKKDSLKGRGLPYAHQGLFLVATVITLTAFIVSRLEIYESD